VSSSTVPENRVAVLAAYAEDVTRLEIRVADLESERDIYRELACEALTRVRALTALVHTQHRALNDRTREIEVALAQETIAVNHWLEAQLQRPERDDEAA
jgi:hypothetical protein